jgi:sulfate permease, SulP family
MHRHGHVRPLDARLATVARPLTGEDEQVTARYTVYGEPSFASSKSLYTQFDYAEDPQHTVIHFSDSHLWDASAIAAWDSVEEKYHRCGKQVETTGLSITSPALRARMSGRLGTGH